MYKELYWLKLLSINMYKIGCYTVSILINKILTLYLHTLSFLSPPIVFSYDKRGCDGAFKMFQTMSTPPHVSDALGKVI